VERTWWDRKGIERWKENVRLRKVRAAHDVEVGASRSVSAVVIVSYRARCKIHLFLSRSLCVLVTGTVMDLISRDALVRFEADATGIIFISAILVCSQSTRDGRW